MPSETSEGRSVRRVIFGDHDEGRSQIAADGPAPRFGRGNLHGVWSCRAVPDLPSDGDEPGLDGIFPPPGGFRFMVVDLEPARDRESDSEYDSFHRTDSFDCGVVISGEVWLELDDGRETLLQAGDTFVQCGTNHNWSNRSGEPCSVAFVLIGAERSRPVP